LFGDTAAPGIFLGRPGPLGCGEGTFGDSAGALGAGVEG